MKNSFYVIIILCIAFMMGIWHIDLVISCNNSVYCGFSNGLWRFNAIQVYHMGLYTAIISFVLMALVAVKETLKTISKGEK
jgi:hypothetical protein